MIALLTSLLLLTGAPHVVADQTPTPMPTACAPNQEASITSRLDPLYPQHAPKFAHPVLVTVVVQLSDTGIVESVAIQRSSGDASVDAAVMSAAINSIYAPKAADCTTIEGSYLYSATFKGTSH